MRTFFEDLIAENLSNLRKERKHPGLGSRESPKQDQLKEDYIKTNCI